jgi:hypothetical protein
MRASSDGMAVPWLTLGARLLMPGGEYGALLEPEPEDKQV